MVEREELVQQTKPSVMLGGDWGKGYDAGAGLMKKHIETLKKLHEIELGKSKVIWQTEERERIVALIKQWIADDDGDFNEYMIRIESERTD